MAAIKFSESADASYLAFGAGSFIDLEIALEWAENDEEQDDFRAVIAQIGRELRAHGNLRTRVKNAQGWKGAENAWGALSAFIGKHRNENPWWSVLDYADSKPLSDEVRAFFERAE